MGPLFQGFLANVFVFWFVLFVWHAVGCLEQHGCCSIDHPLMKQDLLLVVAYVFLGCIWCGCCVWGGVLCENCIVDANAIKIATIIVLLLFVFSFLWFCSWYFLLSVREKCLCFLFFRRMVDAWVC